MRPSCDTTVILDVEGVLFKTRVATLTTVPDSYFHRVFTNQWTQKLDKSGRFFIDRDATVFPVILNYLRDGGSIPLPVDEFLLSKILQEARYFNLPGLVDLSERKISSQRIPLTKPPDQPPNERSWFRSSFASRAKKAARNRMHEKRDVIKITDSRLPVPVLADYLERQPKNQSEAIPMPTRTSTLERAKKKEKTTGDAISLPQNFSHVAHVGWDGEGVVLDRKFMDKHAQAVLLAASENDVAIYNVVNGSDDEFESNSVEVWLGGPHMQSKDSKQPSIDQPPECRSPQPPVYNTPSKRPPIANKATDL